MRFIILTDLFVPDVLDLRPDHVAKILGSHEVTLMLTPHALQREPLGAKEVLQIFVAGGLADRFAHVDFPAANLLFELLGRRFFEFFQGLRPAFLQAREHVGQ